MIYVSRIENGETINEGLCLRCAKEMGLAPVDDMMKKWGSATRTSTASPTKSPN